MASEAEKDGGGSTLKASGQEQRAKPSAELFGFSSVSASQAQCLRSGDRANLKELCSVLGALLQAACLQQGKEVQQLEDWLSEASSFEAASFETV